MSKVDPRLVGSWRLVSCLMEDVTTGQQIASWGQAPSGCLVLTPAGRWIVIQTADGPRPASSDVERAVAFGSMLAYAGRCRTEDGNIVIAVDLAWDESWQGRELTRVYRLDGNTLHIEAAPQAYANFGGKVMRAMLTWSREI